MIKRGNDRARLFILDTNVLMHDPTAIFRFAEHDIFLPMVVLEELDRAKKGTSEVARNVRQVSRFLDELMTKASKQDIDSGLPLPCAGASRGRRWTRPWCRSCPAWCTTWCSPSW